MSSSQYNDSLSSGLRPDSENTPVHSGHVSTGSQLVSEGGQFTGVDMAAETAKFDNAYGAANPHTHSSSGQSSAGYTSGQGGAGYESVGRTDEYSSQGQGFQQSSGGAYQGSTEHQHSSHGHHHHHHGESGNDSYTGNKSEQREQMQQEKKESANEKKEELKERNASGESKSQIAKDENKKVSEQADKETPEGHKPSLMDKVKTAVKNL